MRATEWQMIRRKIATNKAVARAVEVALLEAERRIRIVPPAPSSRLTYKGGTTRAADLVKKMREEEMPAS